MIRVLPLALGAALLCGLARAESVNLEQAVDRALNHDPRIEEVNHLVDSARALVNEPEICLTIRSASSWMA